MIKLFLIDKTFEFWANISNIHFLSLGIATLLIAAGGYIINDYYDIKIDTINKPERVVIGKIIKRRVAIVAHFTLNLFALGIAFFLSWKVFLICFISVFFLWLYSNQLKRLPLVGNVTIALLTGVAVVLPSLQYPQNQELVFLFGIFAIFISLIREIVKDMEDVKGDATFGCQTLPIVWGIPRTKQVIYVFFFTFAIILLSTFLSFPSSFAFYLYVVVIPPLIWFFVRLMRADTRKDFHELSNLCKLIMILGVVSMVLV